jgi:PAS domain-containing protein
MDDAVFVLDHTGTVALTNAAVERLLGPAEANFVPQDEDGQPLPDAQTPRAHGGVVVIRDVTDRTSASSV